MWKLALCHTPPSVLKRNAASRADGWIFGRKQHQVTTLAAASLVLATGNLPQVLIQFDVHHHAQQIPRGIRVDEDVADFLDLLTCELHGAIHSTVFWMVLNLP